MCFSVSLHLTMFVAGLFLHFFKCGYNIFMISKANQRSIHSFPNQPCLHSPELTSKKAFPAFTMMILQYSGYLLPPSSKSSKVLSVICSNKSVIFNLLLP